MNELLEIRGEVPVSDTVALSKAWELPLSDVMAHFQFNRHERTRAEYEHTRCSKCRAIFLARRDNDDCPFCSR